MAAYDFIDEYRKENLTSKKEFDEYKESIKNDVAKRKELTRDELITIQLEQLIYLKFWESNFVIRQFYQLARLANGEDYDWDFDMTNKSRRRVLIDLVRNRIEPLSKSFAELFDSCYKSQIRNAIAHSLCHTIGDTLVFTNFQHNKDDNISSLSFEEWSPYIHKTLVIFDEMIGMRQRVDKFYRSIALKSNYKLLFRLKTKSHDEVRTIEYFPGELNSWGNIQPFT